MNYFINLLKDLAFRRYYYILEDTILLKDETRQSAPQQFSQTELIDSFRDLGRSLQESRRDTCLQVTRNTST